MHGDVRRTVQAIELGYVIRYRHMPLRDAFSIVLRGLGEESAQDPLILDRQTTVTRIPSMADAYQDRSVTTSNP